MKKIRMPFMGKAKRSRKIRKSSSKQVAVRGGFTVPYGAGTRAYVASTAASIMKQNARRASSPGEFLHRNLQNIHNLSVAVEAAGKIYETVKESGVLGDEKVIVASTDQSVARTALATGNIGTVYKTKFHVGGPMKSTIRTAEKVGGSKELTYFDSDIDLTVDADRGILSPENGFNQKRYFWYNDHSYWAYKDLILLSGASSLIQSATKNQRTYWLTKRFWTEFEIYNKNKYMPVTVKIHWLKQIVNSEGPKTKVNGAFTSTIPLPGTPTSIGYGPMPLYEQVTTLAASEKISQCAVDPELGSLFHAPSMLDSFDRIKTYSKTLRPGEVWNFEYCHFTPSGLSLQALADKQDTEGGQLSYNENASAFYYPVFEMVGPQVECHKSTDMNVSYIGTAPGTILLSMKKKCEVVTSPNNQFNVGVSIFDGGGANADWMAFKTFTDAGTYRDEAVIKRRFNVDAVDILREGQAAAANKYIIPITTDMNVKRGGYDNPG